MERPRRGRPPGPHLALDRIRFRVLLATKDLTQSQAAIAAGVCRPHLSLVVCGHEPLTPALAERLAAVLGVPVAELGAPVAGVSR